MIDNTVSESKKHFVPWPCVYTSDISGMWEWLGSLHRTGTEQRWYYITNGIVFAYGEDAIAFKLKFNI